MRSPFPGMDPYLENPALWRGVHHRLITEIANKINAELAPHYVADIDERLYIVQSEHDIRPDVVMFSPPLKEAERPESATMVADAPWQITTLPQPEEIREAFIKIVAPSLDFDVITVIEVLSPTNKMPAQAGHVQYRQKQREVLSSNVHLLEIDLLRAGEHTIAAPEEEVQRLGHADYRICLHRGGKAGNYEVWTWKLPERLPRIYIPLMNSDPDFVLDMQKILDHCYTLGAYFHLIDYQQPPLPPIRINEYEWILNCLQKAGLRS